MNYNDAFNLLKTKGFSVWKQVNEGSIVVGLEIPVSPPLVHSSAEDVKELLPNFEVTEGEDHVLVKKTI